MRVYISGPMSGLPEFNFPAFHSVARWLRERGFEAVNPAEITPQGEQSPPADASPDVHKAYWRKCLRADIKALMDCDALVLLQGWQGSDGAQLELHMAHRVGIKVYTGSEFRALVQAGQ